MVINFKINGIFREHTILLRRHSKTFFVLKWQHFSGKCKAFLVILLNNKIIRQ